MMKLPSVSACLPNLPNLHSTAGPALPPTPPQKCPKIRPKMQTPKKCPIRPKMDPNGGPESARFGPKSALAAFLGLLELKNEPPEGPSEKASNFDRFWDPLGQPQLGSPLSLAQISAFQQDPEKSSFWAPFWLLFGPQIGYDAHFGGPWADCAPKLQGLENRRFFDAHMLAIIVKIDLPKRKRSS